MTGQKIEEKIVEIESKLDSVFEESAYYLHESHWASDLWHPCERWLYYRRMNFPESLPDINLRYRFDEGNDQERKIRDMLSTVKIDLLERGKKVTWKKYGITGKIDGKIRVGKDAFPAEIKSISPYFWESTTTIDKVKNHNSIYVRKMVVQLNLYLFMEGEEFGILILKTFGKKPRFLVLPIDYELGEETLKKVEKVNEHMEIEIIPDRIPYDSTLCDGCSFDGQCLPTKTSDNDMIDDPETIKLFLRWKEIEQEGSEFATLNKKLKDRIRGKSGMVAGCEFKTTKYKTTIYNIPVEKKEIFKEEVERERVTIQRID